MISFLHFIFNLTIIGWMVFGLLWFMNRKDEVKKEKYKKYFITSLVLYIVLIVLVAPLFPENKNDSSKISSESSQLESYKAKESSEKSKKKSEEYSKTESSKSESTKKESDKNSDEAIIAKYNLIGYKKTLKKVPKRTNYAIKSAKVDGKNGRTIVTLPDSVLSYNDSQRKNLVKSAYDNAMKLIDKYRDFPETSRAASLVIQDTEGNILAETSLFGNYKYKG